MKLLFDGNSYLNMALLRGTDHDGGRVVTGPDGKQTQVNGADYGVEGFWDKISKDLAHFDVAPRKCVLVWDGANSKLTRRSHLAQYKEGRDKAPEVSEQLNIARDRVTQMALHLGMHVIQQKNYEADDVLGYLVYHLRTEPNVICTSDGDLSVLVDDNTSVWRLGELNVNPCGPFPHKYILLYKALVGDTSDKIPGAKGFGDAAWVDMVRTFGLEGLDMMVELIENGQIARLAEDVADFKPLQKIIDAKDMVYTSWRVAALLVDEINTMRKPWDLRAGMVAQWHELPDEMRVHELRSFYGTKSLVTAENYEVAYKRFATRVAESPFVALDIETSSSDESDEWIDRVKALTENGKERIDVLGHELTGMSLTFGANTQHTIYMSVDHAQTDNITVDQCREMCELIPQRLHTVIQNRQFEFSVLYRTWGDKWLDNGWHGFVPNALDTKVGASIVNENLGLGLKARSLAHLGYTQQTYEQTTTKSGPVGSLAGGERTKVFKQEVAPAVYKENVITINDEWVDDDGEIHQSVSEQVTQEIVTPAVFGEWESRQYKMRELTGVEVLGYGADDTITTAALHTHYQFIMELENTWQAFLDVHQLPEYLTSLAFVQGCEVSLSTMAEMEREDAVRYDAAWKVLREFLMEKGWEGTACPEFEGDIEPSDVKLALPLILDGEFSTKKRKLNAIAVDIREQFPNNAHAEVLANIVEKNDVEELNKLLRQNFTGEPKLNFGSPKQLQRLFYHVMGMTPRIFNSLTEKQRDVDEFRSAFKKMRQAKDGKVVEYTAEEREALISKASTDDSAVATSLHFDNPTGKQREVLEAYSTIKEVTTRRNLFYKTWKAVPHWRDGRVHSSLNQAQAATRRYSSSAPNVQQLPSKGDGAKFRTIIQPHHRDAVIVSCDFSGQELRGMAEQCGDAALTACYVGDKLFDVHSLTAVQAAIYLWGETVTYEQFMEMLNSSDESVKKRAKALRGQAKTVVFASQFGAQAPNIAQQLFVDEATAQQFLDAKDKAFPRIEAWKAEFEDEAARVGYAKDLTGFRRHLAQALMSDNKWEAAKAARQASNFAIQASAASQTLLAMCSMWRNGLFTSGKYDAQFLFPVHDECVASVHKDHAVEFTREFHACMTQPFAGVRIPIVSSIDIGRNFGDLIEIGEKFDEAKIQKALCDIFGAGK